jgi:hypothetical protein
MNDMMHSKTKDWNGPISFTVSIACLALVASCLAQESQVPMNVGTASKIKWEECDELNNHKLQCKHHHD